MTTPYDAYIEPRRLHPLTIFYNLLTNLPGLAIAYYFVIVNKQSDQLFFLIITLIGLLLIVPASTLNYIFFTYQITPRELIIRSGIFAKKQRNIPLERIQNINVNQNFLQRIFGLVKVSIETAGDIATEGALQYVSVKDSNDISDIIRNYKFRLQKSQSEENAGSSVLEKAETDIATDTLSRKFNNNVIFELSWRNLLFYGMVRLRPLALVVGMWIIGMFSQFGLWEDVVEDFINNLANSIGDVDVFTMILLILSFVFLSALLSWILDIIWTINEYYKFKLANEEGKLITSYGLFNKVKVTIPLKKLQQITILTNPVKQMFNFYTMTLQTAGFGTKTGTNQSVVPLAKRDELIELSQRIYDFDLPQKFRSISRKSIRRAFIRYFISVSILITPGIIAVPELAWSAFGIPLLYYAAYLRWLYRGYHIHNNYLIIKEGFWLRKIIILPLKKLQTLHLQETFFQRRLGLATLYIDNASSAGIADAKIIDIDATDAKEIYDEIYDNFKMQYVHKIGVSHDNVS